MTRVLVQRGSSGGGSSSNVTRSAGSSSNSSARAEAQVLVSQENCDEAVVVVSDEVLESGDKGKSEDSVHFEQGDGSCDDDVSAAAVVESDVREGTVKGLSGLRAGERVVAESEGSSGDSSSLPVGGGSCPPPPPVPPPKPSVAGNLNPRRSVAGSLNSGSVGSSRRTSAWPVGQVRTSPAGSRPSSPRSHNESEGYNSADEQKPCLVSSYDDFERERQFEIDIRRAKGYEVKKMMEDGNCLFRAVADQVYGDSELYDLVRQMCIDYMERERDHFSQFITEGFTSYCKRKRRDKETLSESSPLIANAPNHDCFVSSSGTTLSPKLWSALVSYQQVSLPSKLESILKSFSRQFPRPTMAFIPDVRNCFRLSTQRLYCDELKEYTSSLNFRFPGLSQATILM